MRYQVNLTKRECGRVPQGCPGTEASREQKQVPWATTAPHPGPYELKKLAPIPRSGQSQDSRQTPRKVLSRRGYRPSAVRIPWRCHCQSPEPSNVGGQPRAAPARPGFLPEDAARLVGWSALFGSPPFPRTALVVLSTPRSASLTASSEGKAAATSGSSKTKLLPLRSRATYLPRTPPFIDAKSYSGRRSLSLCRFALFIELSLAPRRSTGADDADGVVSLRVGHNQDVSPRGCTDCQETGLRL